MLDLLDGYQRKVLDMPLELNANEFLKKLKALRSASVAKAHGHLASDDDDMILGVRMGQVFALAKEFMDMPLAEVKKLLESPIHEARVGAVSIMDFQARSKKTTEARRKELFDLYIKRHDRIDTWDLVLCHDMPRFGLLRSAT